MTNDKFSGNETSFFEYLGVDEQNMLTLMNIYKPEYAFFLKLDQLYQKWLNVYRNSKIKGNYECIVASLLWATHSYLYFCFACAFRTHFSEACAALRKSIDAAFTAYKIIEEPSLAEAYIDKSHKDNKIFIFIKKNLKQNLDKFPLAKNLIERYESYSEHSHIDFVSFMHRFNVEGDKMKIGYTQFTEDIDEGAIYFATFLFDFIDILQIYKHFYNKKVSGIILAEIESLKREEQQLRKLIFDNVRPRIMAAQKAGKINLPLLTLLANNIVVRKFK